MQLRYNRLMETEILDPETPLAELLGYHLRRASAVMMTDLGERLATVGLRPTEATILLLIDTTPGCIQSDIGRILGIQRANMAPLIGSLEKNGFISRSPVDGRSHALSLTDAGSSKLAEARAQIDEHERNFQSMFSKSEGAALIAAMRKISASAKA